MFSDDLYYFHSGMKVPRGGGGEPRASVLTGQIHLGGDTCFKLRPFKETSNIFLTDGSQIKKFKIFLGSARGPVKNFGEGLQLGRPQMYLAQAITIPSYTTMSGQHEIYDVGLDLRFFGISTPLVRMEI